MIPRINRPETIPSSIYRKIVQHELPTKQERTDLNRIGKFSFLTVVHRRMNNLMHLQSACDCAHRHECFDHISRSAAINRGKMIDICTWIDAGVCPHVNLADIKRHEIRETYVSPLEVAIAADYDKLYPYLLLFAFRLGESPVDWINSINTATIKGRPTFFANGYAYSSNFLVDIDNTLTRFHNLVEAIDSDTSDGFNVVDTDPARYCVEMNNMRLLKLIFNRYLPLQKALEDAVLADKEEFTEVLLNFYFFNGLKKLNFAMRERHERIPFIQTLAVIAILKKNYKVLKTLEDNGMLCEQYHCSKTYSETHDFNTLDIALLFEEDTCASILSRDLKPSRTTQTINPYQVVVDASRAQRNPTHCIALLKSLRERGFDINQTDKHGDTVLMSLSWAKMFRIVTQRPLLEFVHPDVFGALLDLGCDVNKANCDGIKPLLHCLTTRAGWMFVDRMAIVKLCLYHNTVMEPGKETIYAECALNVDKEAYIPPRNLFPRYPRVEFQMDFPDVHFNDLVTPLLWECGLEWEAALIDRETTPDILQKFMTEKMRQPRSLQMLCRNTVRRAYPGKHNLQAYLRHVGSPQNLNNYILMNNVFNINT